MRLKCLRGFINCQMKKWRTDPIEKVKKSYKGNSIAFLFGPEKAGLQNKDLSQANMIINIPTVNAFGSLNLAMSVNIIILIMIH